MSKYNIFTVMKLYNVLIILGFTVVVICSDISYLTYEKPDDVCYIKYFRKRRALPEYTRWKANTLTSTEFLVKVLDDDLTTPLSQKIVAVNIQPIASKSEKIIVGGGAVVSPVSTARQSSELTKDYTRFIPPTTLPVKVLESNLHPVLQQFVKAHEIPPIKPNDLKSQRDESPPASPQFLGRTPISASGQFAPIAPVAFSLQATFTPRKPSSVAYERVPTRTSPLPDVVFPTRTRADIEIPDDFERYFVGKINPIGETANIFDHYSLGMTTVSNSLEFSPDTSVSEEIIYKDSRRSDSTNKIDTDKVEHDSDNMVFYDDDESDKNKNKEENYDLDSYDENLHTTECKTVQNDSDVHEFISITTDSGKIYEEEEEFTAIKKSGAVQFSTENFASEDALLITRHNKICNLLKFRQMNFNSPRTLPEINAQLKLWANNSPIVKMDDITAGNLTIMENQINLMMIEDLSSGQIVSAKQTVMIVAGIQGRDHHAVTAAMYVLYQLIERSDAHADLLSKYRFWIIPVFNPDGYDYSMTFPHQREWSKNLRQNWEMCNNREVCNMNCELYGLGCAVQSCYGVNLDRNFEYQWIPAEELRAEHPCGPLYAGPRQLSEPETRALTHYLRHRRTPLTTFVAFKEGDVLGIMYPYSHTRKRRAYDNVFRQRASRAASAAYSISGRPYVAGQTSEFLPLYAGGIEDWVDGHLGIDNTYTVMMFRPTDAHNSKLVTERVVHEAYAALDTLLLQSGSEPLAPPPPQVTLKRTVDGSSTITPDVTTTFCFTFTVIFISRFIDDP